MKLPYMPLWANDIDLDRDCRSMSDAQFGRYMRLMIRQWIEGSVPVTAVEAMRDAMLDPGSEGDVQSLLDRKFGEKIGSGRGNTRLNQVRAETLDKCLANKERASKAGKASASARCSTGSSTGSSTDSQPRGSDSDFVSDSGSSSNLIDTFTDALWELAPRMARQRSSKAKVRTEVRKLGSSRPGVDEMTAAYRAWLKCAMWTKDDGEYVPGLHRWVKDRQFEDVPQPASPAITDPAGIAPILGSTER